MAKRMLSRAFPIHLPFIGDFIRHVICDIAVVNRAFSARHADGIKFAPRPAFVGKSWKIAVFPFRLQLSRTIDRTNVRRWEK